MGNSVLGSKTQIGNYKRRCSTSSSSFAGGYVPSDIPTKRTKETMESALNDFFKKFIKNDNSAVSKMKYILEIIKNDDGNKWKSFNCVFYRFKFNGYTFKGNLNLTKDSIFMSIYVNNSFKGVKEIIEDKTDPDSKEDKYVKRVIQLYNEIMS